MVIIPNYLSVCLSPGFPLARSPGHRPRGPSGLLACFLLLLLSQCVNELSVPRPPQEPSPPASALPRLRPPGRPGRPLFPFGGAKVHLFFEPPNFSRKIFRKVFSPRLPPPLALPPLPRSRGTGPQKYCFFPFRQTFSKEIFEKIFNKLAFNTVTARGFPSPKRAPDTHPPGPGHAGNGGNPCPEPASRRLPTGSHHPPKKQRRGRPPESTPRTLLTKTCFPIPGIRLSGLPNPTTG